MHAIIQINFLVIAIFASCASCAGTIIFNCTIIPKGKVYECGSDGITYKNIYYLWCKQKTEYGKRVNLQLKHPFRCFIWESYGIETTTFLFVSHNFDSIDWNRSIEMKCSICLIFQILLGLISLSVCLCIYRKNRSTWSKMRNFCENA